MMITPDEDAGEQLSANGSDNLVPLLPIALTDGGNDQMIIVLKNEIAKGQGEMMSLLIDQIFARIEPIAHQIQFYGISVLSANNSL
jgi:hypothetical protein